MRQSRMEPRHRPTWLAVAAGVLVLAASAGLWLLARPRPSAPSREPARGAEHPDPRLSYAGPFENVRPGVRYVGSAACTRCHKARAASFARHPMGRSLTPLNRFASPPADLAHHNPFTALDRTFRIVPDGDRVLHRQEWPDAPGIAPLDLRADYAIGSGTRGYSFLTVRDGYVFQTPISWYSQKQLWDLSPAFGPDRLAGRPVAAECLFCHANRVRPVAGSRNRYEVPVFEGHAIGCERCHGPGERHVAVRKPREVLPGTEPTIVHPGRLPWRLREAVCEQCHLEGATRVAHRGRALEEYRPGMPLEAFASVFLLARGSGEVRKAVGQVEQMHESRCFRDSPDDDKLGCVSCHDPHRRVAPEGRAAHYRVRCLKCHDKHGCSMPRAERRRESPADSCIQCHMPPFSTADVPHTAATDHRIPRRKGQVDEGPAGPAGAGPLLAFYRDRIDSHGPEVRRDLGLALVTLEGKYPALTARYALLAVSLLEEALRQDAGDVEAWEKKARALMLQNRMPEALAAVQSALARAPDRESAVAAAAHLTQELGQLEPAIGHWRKAIALNPWRVSYRVNLALLLAHKRDWDEAGRQCRELLRLDPGNAQGRKVLVQCLLRTGRRDEGRAEFARLRALRPPDLAELERWYTTEGR